MQQISCFFTLPLDYSSMLREGEEGEVQVRHPCSQSLKFIPARKPQPKSTISMDSMASKTGTVPGMRVQFFVIGELLVVWARVKLTLLTFSRHTLTVVVIWLFLFRCLSSPYYFISYIVDCSNGWMIWHCVGLPCSLYCTCDSGESKSSWPRVLRQEMVFLFLLTPTVNGISELWS